MSSLQEWFEDGSSGMSSTSLSLSGFGAAKAKVDPAVAKATRQAVADATRAENQAKAAATKAANLAKQAAKTGNANTAAAAATAAQNAQALANTAQAKLAVAQQAGTATPAQTKSIAKTATAVAATVAAVQATVANTAAAVAASGTGTPAGKSKADLNREAQWLKQCEKNSALAQCIWRAQHGGQWPTVKELAEFKKSAAGKADVVAAKAEVKTETLQAKWEKQCQDAKNVKLIQCVYKAQMGHWPESQQALTAWAKTTAGKAAVVAVKDTAKQSSLEKTWEQQCLKNTTLAQCVYKAQNGRWPTASELAAFKKSVEGKADIKAAKIAKKLANGQTVQITAKDSATVDKANVGFNMLKKILGDLRACQGRAKKAVEKRACAASAKQQMTAAGLDPVGTSTVRGLALSGLGDYQYDAEGNIIGVTDGTPTVPNTPAPGTLAPGMCYDPQGNVVLCSTLSQNNDPTFTQKFDAVLEAKCLKHPTNQKCLTYAMTQQTQQMMQAMLNQMTQMTQLIYDLISQLSQAQDPSTGVCYDENGNVVACTTQGDGSTGLVSSEGQYSGGAYSGGMTAGGGYGATGMVSGGYGAATGDVSGDGLIAAQGTYGGGYSGAGLVSDTSMGTDATSALMAQAVAQGAGYSSYGLDVAGDGMGQDEYAMQPQAAYSRALPAAQQYGAEQVPSGVGDETLPASFFQQEVAAETQGYAPGGEDVDMYAMADQYATQEAAQRTTVQPSGAVVTAVLPPSYVSPVGQAVPAQFAVPAPQQPAQAALDAGEGDEALMASLFQGGEDFAEMAVGDEMGMADVFAIMSPLVTPGVITSPMPVFATAATEPKAVVEEGATMETLFGPGGEFAGAVASDQQELNV